MGYYVTLTESTATILAQNIDKAYQAVLTLNSQDELKIGGAFPGATEPKPEGSEFHPHRWFSWMPADLRTLPDLMGVLSALGFEFEGGGGVPIRIYGYDNKSGQERLFFQAMAPYIEPDSFMEWEGEDGYRYRWEFKGGVMGVIGKNN